MNNISIPLGCSKLHVLIYHRILPGFDPLRSSEVTHDIFETHLKILKKWFNVVPLVEGYHRLLEGSLAHNSVSITFDDGYQDNIDIALPLLKAYDMPASFFIATSFLNDQIMFNDTIIESIRRYHEPFFLGCRKFDCSKLSGKKAAIEAFINKVKPQPLQERYKLLDSQLPKINALPRLMMKESGVKQLARSGMHIGAHTAHHPLLSHIADNVAINEMHESKHALEDIIQKPVSWFAYPNGKKDKDFSQKHMNMAKELGFVAALSTDWGMITKDSDPFCLPRFTPWQQAKIKFILKMAAHRFGF